MTTDLRAHLDRLDTALSAATPGPWEVVDEDNFEGIAIARPPGYSETPVVATDVGVVLAADAAAIVAAVNNLPWLLAAVRAAADLADELDTESADYVAEADPLPTTNPRRGQLVARALGKKAAAARLRTALTEGVAR